MLFGKCDTVVSGGEVVQWHLGLFGDGSLCACGASADNCRVLAKVRNGISELANTRGLSIDELADIQTAEESRWRILSRAISSGNDDANRMIYENLQMTIFSALKEQKSGTMWIVDSSKTASWIAGRPFSLLKMRDVQFRFVHLVRNPLDVVASVLRGSNREMESGIEKRSWLRACKAILGWNQANLYALAMRFVLGKDQCTIVRYEDLIRDHALTINTTLSRIGVDTKCDQNTSGEVTYHLFSGNRMRFTRPDVRPFNAAAPLNPMWRFAIYIFCYPMYLYIKYLIRRG
jgi:hypothetical protein